MGGAWVESKELKNAHNQAKVPFGAVILGVYLMVERKSFHFGNNQVS